MYMDVYGCAEKISNFFPVGQKKNGLGTRLVPTYTLT